MIGIETLLGLLLASPRNKTVVGAARRYWVILQFSSDGRNWVTKYSGPASGDDAGNFISAAPMSPPYLAETWYVHENNRWRKQGTTTNFGG